MKFHLHITFIILFIQLALENVHAQINKQQKEEINITSSFKPSIIKSPKLEFRPDAILRDTTRYKFSYEPVKLSFSTPMSGFTIKPLAYAAPTKEIDGNQFIAQMGYGNLKSPFGSLSYASSKADQFLQLNADYFSMKGKLPDQQHAIGTIGASYKKRISENYQYKLGARVENFNYRNYGYDRTIYVNVPLEELKQKYTNFNVNAALNNVAGEEGKINVNPTFALDFLTTNRKYNTLSSSIEMPTYFNWKKGFTFKSVPSFSWLHVNAVQRSFVDDIFLLKLPVSAEMIHQNWVFNLTALPAYFNKQLKFMPNIFLKHILNDGKWHLKGGFQSIYEINSPYKILLQNPFVHPMLNSISPVYEQHYLFAGFDLHSKNGYSIDIETGATQHKNIPLFINNGLIGKDFLTIFESSLRTIDLKSSFTYFLNHRLTFSSDLKWTSFQRQVMYEKPFGMLPFQWGVKTTWKPIEKLTLLFNSSFWTGSYANNSVSTVKLSTVADINLHFKYNLNDKWGFWLDLNNIANVQYQRWNQYTAYGFNFIGGIKYVLGKPAKQ